MLARVAGGDLSTLLPTPFRSKRIAAANGEKHLTPRRCYHHNGMRPQTIGRVLGTGLRVAGRMAGERLAASAQSAPAQQPRHQAQPLANAAVRVQAARQTRGQAGGGVARGVGGFLRPFRRVGGIIWLEVTGVFFLLPVVVFTPNLWRMRASWAHGPDHRMFLITTMVVAVFLYLGVTSFWWAHGEAEGDAA